MTLFIPIYTADLAGLEQALDALGDTADQVAAKLAAMGCNGTPGMAEACPIGHYLEQVMPCGYENPDDCGVAVECDEDVIRVRVEDAGWLRINTPGPVARFIVAFDRNDYPGLAA
jgi:hypothetical protein